ncbi:MAG TPA: hypothetical protein VGJ56_08150, partial [Reyranella sp.]
MTSPSATHFRAKLENARTPPHPHLNGEELDGVVVAGSAPLRQARRFFFSADTEISNAAASDSLGNLAPERQRPRL